MLVGSVRDVNGAAVAKMRVSAWSAFGRVAKLGERLEPDVVQLTDDDGRFVMEYLPAGLVALRGEQDGRDGLEMRGMVEVNSVTRTYVNVVAKQMGALDYMSPSSRMLRLVGPSNVPLTQWSIQNIAQTNCWPGETNAYGYYQVNGGERPLVLLVGPQGSPQSSGVVKYVTPPAWQEDDTILTIENEAVVAGGMVAGEVTNVTGQEPLKVVLRGLYRGYESAVDMKSGQWLISSVPEGIYYVVLSSAISGWPVRQCGQCHVVNGKRARIESCEVRQR